jgi:hypothetical protein
MAESMHSIEHAGSAEKLYRVACERFFTCFFPNIHASFQRMKAEDLARQDFLIWLFRSGTTLAPRKLGKRDTRTASSPGV